MAEGEDQRRSFGDDVRSPEGAAEPRRSFAARILRRVSRFAPAGRAPRVAPDRPQFDLSAPLSSLVSSRAVEGATEGFSLSFLLRESANAIERGKYMLGDRAREVSQAISARRDGELMLMTQGLRLLIALGWLFLGMSLDRQALAALATGAPQVVAGMPTGDAQIVARIFLVIGGIGVIAAFLGGFLVNLTGKASNVGVRRSAANLGAEAADLAKRFDATLDSLRAQMDRRGDRADAVEDLSRMHVTALEAASFFQGVQFLTDPDRGDAAAKFRAYLRDHAGFAASSGVSPVIALVFGLIMGLALGYGAWAPAPAVAAAPVGVSPLFAYPWVTIAALGGAVLFVAAGGLLGAVAGPVTASAGESARDEALDAVRGAFVAGNAPRIEDVIRRIEDALAVYKARLGGGGTTQRHAGAGGADLKRLEDTPSWRRPPEGPRFVAPSFDAAPKAFLADAPKAPNGVFGGFFARKGRSEAAPKQGADSPETPPWLKD